MFRGSGVGSGVESGAGITQLGLASLFKAFKALSGYSVFEVVISQAGMEDSNGLQDTPGLPRVGCSVISVPMDEERYRGKFLPLATARKNAFYDVLLMTKGSSSGESADEGRYTISVKCMLRLESWVLAENVFHVLIKDFVGAKRLWSEVLKEWTCSCGIHGM